MSEKIYIGDNYYKMYDWFRENCPEESPPTNRFITPELPDKLLGMELSWDQIVIVGDPVCRFSFWQLLQSRIRK